MSGSEMSGSEMSGSEMLGSEISPFPSTNTAAITAATQTIDIAFFGAINRNKGVLELLQGFIEYNKKTKKTVNLHLWGKNFIGKEFEKYVNDNKLRKL